MPSVYDSDAFSTRVNYAKRCILSGMGRSFYGYTRAFDTCFEMYDGAAVATALVRKADQDPDLAYAIGPDWLAQLRITAEKYADVPTRKLSALARNLRETR